MPPQESNVPAGVQLIPFGQQAPGAQQPGAGVPAGVQLIPQQPQQPQRQAMTLQEFQQKYENETPWWERTAFGVGKAGLTTIQGAEKLVNRGLRATGFNAQLPVMGENLDTAQHGIAEHLGGLAENVVEFEAGSAVLKGLGVLGRLSNTSPKLLALAKNNPVVAKMLTEAFKAGTVGAAQGAVKGAAEDKAGAEAAGGAIGGAVGGALGPLTSFLGRQLGIAGLTGEEALVKGGRPNVKEAADFRAALKASAPVLWNAIKQKGMKTVGDFVDIIGEEADKVRNNIFNPMIDRWKNDLIGGWPIARQVMQRITSQMRDYRPEEVQGMLEWAKTFIKGKTLENWESDLRDFNAHLTKLYRASDRDAAGMLKTNPEITKYEAAADALRDTIYSHLNARGERGAAEAQRLWGGLKDLERTFEKRATVAERQNAISLPNLLTGLSAIMESRAAFSHGGLEQFLHGLAPLALGIAYRIRNAPETMVKTGLRTIMEEIGQPTLRTRLVDNPAIWFTQHVPRWVGALSGQELGREMAGGGGGGGGGGAE